MELNRKFFASLRRRRFCGNRRDSSLIHIDKKREREAAPTSVGLGFPLLCFAKKIMGSVLVIIFQFLAIEGKVTDIRCSKSRWFLRK